MKRKMLVEKMIIIQCLEVTINRGSLSMLTLKSHCVQFNLLPGKCSWDCSLRSFECNRFFLLNSCLYNQSVLQGLKFGRDG